MDPERFKGGHDAHLFVCNGTNNVGGATVMTESQHVMRALVTTS